MDGITNSKDMSLSKLWEMVKEREARRAAVHEFAKLYMTERLTLQFSSVQSLNHVCLFATPWTAARQASLSITNPQSLLKLMSIESVMPSNHLILCRPLLLLPPIFLSIRVFSNESALRIKWPEYWAFSLSKHQNKGMLCYVPRCVLNRPAIQGHSIF